MKLADIFVGRPKTIEFNGNKVTTAIFKDAILGPVAVKKIILMAMNKPI